MKKVYLIATSMILSGMLPAQSVNQPIDATGKSSTNQLVGQTPTKRFKYNPPANQVASSIKNNKSFNNNQQKAPPAIIFSEDFQNGIPGTWTIIDNDGLTPNTSVSQFTNAWIGAEDFDNAADTVAMSTSWYTPAGQSDDWLITPAITLTTNNVLAWEAEAQDPAFPDGYEVRISTVGPTIADFLANTALFSIAAESGGVWTQRTVDLQAAGYSNQTVYIAWRNNSNDQFILMVDDISVGDQAQFDAAIDAVPMHQYAEYSLIPLSQVETYTFTADLKNNGVQTVTNATLNVSVNQAFVGNVYTGASTPIASLASGVIQTASVTTPFTPADTGVYTIDYIVSITETDGNTTNDTMTETLMVIDSIFSRDDGVVSGSLGIGPGTPGTLGQVFELKNPDTLTSVSFYITNNNDVMVGQSISVSIYDVNGPPNTIIGSTDTFTVTATGAQFITLSISGGPLPLSADTFYLGVEEADSNVTLGTSANIFLQNVTWLDFPGSPTGTWANNEDFAFNVIYVLRANFGPVPSTCDITLNSITGTDVLCTNDNTGSATVSVSGTSTPYTYAWSNGATGATASNLVAGNYTVTVTDASACTVDTSVTITQPASALSVTTSSTNETSFGANDGTATATPSGGTSPYSYSWSNAATTQTISGLTPGTYTVTITDANGCTASGSTVVNSFVCNLTVTITATDETSVGGNDGAATATPAGGTSPYTYDWSTTGTTQTISGLAPGTYSVTVTDNSGCTTNGSVVVNSFICNLTITVSATDETGAGNDDGTTTATPSGGSSPYTYLWDDSNNQTTATATGLAAGTYNVTVTDASGCTATGSAIVNASGCAMTATAAESSAINCNGGTDGAAMATPAGGTSPYTYMWNDVNNQTGQTATGLGAGTYNVTVTDFLNCTATASVTLNEPTALTASVTGTDETSAGANDGTATATASGGTTIYSYLWSNSATTASISGLAPGSYSVTVTDANGCTVTGSVAVNAAGCLLTVSVSGTDETSAGAGDGTATATPSNGTSPYTYTWDDANSQTTQIATGLIPNTYNVTVTDANGCTASGSVIINAAGCNITVSVTGTDESSVGANDGTATANASSGTQPYTYSWSNGNTTQTITGLAPGTYTVTVTDNAGCSVSGSVTISAFNCPPITLTTSSTDESAAGANDGTASVTASGGSTPYSYIWSNGQTDQTATGLSAGAYCVTVADANNCTATACDSVNTGAGCNVTVTISTTDETTAGANDGIAAASVAGGTTPYTYLWSNGGTSAIISGLAPGTYTVTVTDASGCTASGSGTVNAATGGCDIAIAGVSTTDPLCNGDSDGEASVTVSGASGTSLFAENFNSGGMPAGWTLIDNDGLTPDPSVAFVNNAWVIAEDFDTTGTGDSIALSTSWYSPAGISDDWLITPSVTLTTGNLLEWDAKTPDANFPDGYEVRISTTTPDIAGFNANAALLSITAENQTWTKRAVDLQAAGYSNQAVYIAFRNNSDDKFLLGIDNVSISEMGPLTYNWSNGGTTATATGLSAGSYSVTVTDGTCSVDTTITITQPAIVAPTVTSTDETTSGASDGTATATGSGGTSPYTYTWSNSATTQTISGLSPGIYMVTLTDANGCTGNGVAVVNLAGCTLTVTASSTDETVAGANDGTATATAANGTTPYSYDWIGVDTTQTITDLAPGVYNVVVTDTAGCLATASVTINAGAVGIADKTIESITLSVYPNPAKEYLNINLVLGKEDVFKIDIVNNIGQRVHFISGVKSSQFTDVINTSDWTSGLYFIMVQTPNAVKVEKLVIR